MGLRHFNEVCGAFQTYCDMTELRKHLEVAPRPTAEIEYRERRLTLDVLQQRGDILADIVIVRAFVKILGIPVVVLKRQIGNFIQFLRGQFHEDYSSFDTTGVLNCPHALDRRDELPGSSQRMTPRVSERRLAKRPTVSIARRQFLKSGASLALIRASSRAPKVVLCRSVSGPPPGMTAPS